MRWLQLPLVAAEGSLFQQANCWCVPGSPLQDEFPQDTNDALLRLMGWGWRSARVPTHYVSPPFEGDPPTPPPWYFRQQADRIISVAVIFWHKHLRHFGLINIFTWFFLETHTSSGQYHLGTVFHGKHNIIVEHSQPFHRSDTYLYFLGFQAFAIGGDDVAAPIKGLLLVALQDS